MITYCLRLLYIVIVLVNHDPIMYTLLCLLHLSHPGWSAQSEAKFMSHVTRGVSNCLSCGTLTIQQVFIIQTWPLCIYLIEFCKNRVWMVKNNCILQHEPYCLFQYFVFIVYASFCVNDLTSPSLICAWFFLWSPVFS